MSSRHRTFIVFMVLVVLGTALALAQETTGGIFGLVSSQDGQPLPGVTLIARNPDTGLELSVVSDRRGQYRFPSLPPARYTVTATLEGFQTSQRTVPVALGQTVTGDVEMAVGAFTGTIEVTSQRPTFDLKSTVPGIVVSADELNAQLPIVREVTQIALLAPATLAGDSRFSSERHMVPTPLYSGPGGYSVGGGPGGYTPGQNSISIGGSSVAENAYQLNGLNLTNFFNGIGSTFVPLEFVDQVQVKTGGYEAEFGRSTGGVINMVTKSGGNALRGSAGLYWQPETLQRTSPDTFVELRSLEELEVLEANAGLSGPIVRDHLFLFGFVRWQDTDSLLAETSRAQRQHNRNPYWGGKLDWNVTPSHRLEGTYLSDDLEVDQTLYELDPEARQIGDVIQTGAVQRGGTNWIVRYTGLLTDNLAVYAQHGWNDFERTNSSDGDECPNAHDLRSGQLEQIGCWVNAYIGSQNDQREASRIDVDWFVGRHSLRAGADVENNATNQQLQDSGGVDFAYYLADRFPELPPDQEIVRVQHEVKDGSYGADSWAAYLQDSWAVTPRLTVNLGLRHEEYNSQDNLGQTFIEVTDQWAPRVGAIWDPVGNGSSKVYASYGLYHLPVASNVNTFLAAGEQFDRGYYLLDGDLDPFTRAPAGYVDRGFGTSAADNGAVGEELDYQIYLDGGTPDPRGVAADNMEPMSQSEVMLGYERTVGASWTLGVRGVARWFNEVIEDMALDRALWEVYGVESCSPDVYGCYAFRLANPGSDFSGWFDLDDDGELDPVYLTAEQIGMPEPERTYYAVELTFRRRFAESWMLQGSYTWSHSYGNYEGWVLSDTGNDGAGLTQTFDWWYLLENARGDLPNDRRHNLKLFGMYASDRGFQFGGHAWFRTGRPISGFGVHPTDPYGVSAWWGYPSFYNNGEPCPRGCGGRTDDLWSLDLMLGYRWQWTGADWNLRFDIFNVFDRHGVAEVDEWAEYGVIGESNPTYLEPTDFQTPRRLRLGFGVTF